MTTDELIEELKKYPGATLYVRCDGFFYWPAQVTLDTSDGTVSIDTEGSEE